MSLQNLSPRPDFGQKKGRPKPTLKKSLGEDAYKAFPVWRNFNYCASANIAITVANDATVIYRFFLIFATFARSRRQKCFVAVRQNEEMICADFPRYAR
jgi:hypothetical protein